MSTHCRVTRWWEQQAFQLKLLAMLLVVVNGRPAGNYLQILMLLCLCIAELPYQACLQPYRFSQSQLIRIMLYVMLCFSLVAALFLVNCGEKASHGGLTAIAIGQLLPMFFFVHTYLPLSAQASCLKQKISAWQQGAG